MKGDIFKTGGLLLMLPFLSGAGFNDVFSPPDHAYLSDSSKRPAAFGMRIRTRKPGGNVIAPTFIVESPGNEATMVRLQDDDELKIFYINRPGSADKLMSQASLDNGLSWKAPHAEFALSGEAYYANQVFQGKDRELHCVFHIFGTGENGYRKRHLNLFYCKTKNGRRKWTQAQKIYDGYVGSIRGFIQLQNGRLLMAFAKAVPEREQKPQSGIDYGWNEVISLYSDDNGVTWQRSGNSVAIDIDGLMATRYGAVEPSIIELKDGRIWMLIRTSKGHLYESYSDDSGKTWESPKVTHFISSDSPADVLRLSDDRLVLLWCMNQRWDDARSYAMGGREVLHGAISSDEGKTWKGFREVLTAPSGKGVVRGDRGTAYPSAEETADKKVVFVSGQGEAKSIVVLQPDWLEKLSAHDNFSEGLAQWTLYGSDSLTSLIRLRDQNVLHIGKSYNGRYADTEAVWNFPMISKGALTAEIEMRNGCKGVSLALTDHFSIAGDKLASKHAVLHFILDKGMNKILTQNRNRLSVKIAWDRVRQAASLFLNGKLFSESKFERQTFFGLNYLRVGIPGTGEDLSGFYLHSVKVTGTDNGD